MNSAWTKSPYFCIQYASHLDQIIRMYFKVWIQIQTLSDIVTLSTRGDAIKVCFCDSFNAKA